MATFNQIIKEIIDDTSTERDRGTAFEEVVKAYLQNEPAYKHLYDKVWMLGEVPDEYHIPKKDTGVDLVARKCGTNELTAVQAKFYRGRVAKDDVNSFIAECSKNYYTDGLLITTTDQWGQNAENALNKLSKPITRIGLSQLENANIDWQLFKFNSDNQNIQKKSSKKLRDYQKTAVDKAVSYYKKNNRGKLIMAPGTGKTFTSLKIAEALMQDQHKTQFYVLYLVPSIQLLSQTLRNWNDDISDDINLVSFSVVSDRKASKFKNQDVDDDIAAKDIGFPATTDVKIFMHNYRQLFAVKKERMVVVFSTYQSIDMIHIAQEQGFPEFDLIVADEAHRTTGAKELGEPSIFTKVHYNENIKGKLRLYQTATPKIYGQNAKKKAIENSIVLSSMDDVSIYGEEIFRYTFGYAVEHGYLTDYKVSVLAVSKKYVNKNLQSVIAKDNKLDVNDIAKIVGVWNAMVKRNGLNGAITGAPMKRAIGFTDTIADSEKLASEFNTVVNNYLNEQYEDSFHLQVRHVDGTLNALEKKDALDWLSGDIPENQARVLSNVRFLTEGVDVPNLDAIIFFNPKHSQIDIVQAVGRIMRKYPGKEYGYIILPVVINVGADPKAVLDNDQKYQTVWQVLNALRSTDERFDVEVNKLQLNKNKSDRINFIGVDTAPKKPVTEQRGKEHEKDKQDLQLSFNDVPKDWQEIKQAFYGRIVEKVGDRRYLEDWSKDVADIAKSDITRINALINTQPDAKTAFNHFLKSLQHNINKSINQVQAVEMLAQHLITQPVFEALFSGNDFVNDNPVSKAMNDVVRTFKSFGFDKEQKPLQGFYDSVKKRVSGIDNAAAKQQTIVTLYEKFFSKGFPRTTQKLGIVFTPVEVVDFIIHSVDDALRKYLNVSLDSQNVHILDPFVGTGTFITRTLAYLKQELDEGQITYTDIVRKYTQELHCNEIVLLSYYIAAVNIENAFSEIGTNVQGYNYKYLPFDGIVLTDTFESAEKPDLCNDDLFGENDERLREQQKEPITVIISNPPYSVGQKNQNDNNQNVHYPNLEHEIANTYVKNSNAGFSKGAYDSYIKAFRWASNRLSGKGVIGFVTNGSYLDSKSTDGFRASLYKEFNELFIFNLRGNQRTQGEQSRKEGGKIFGSGSRAPIAISILVKDGSNRHELYYHDIGDYLDRKQKLDTIKNFGSISNIPLQRIIPDRNNDWINQRNPNYQRYTWIADDNNTTLGAFKNHALGVVTNRDTWVYSFSKEAVSNNVQRMINNYNGELRRLMHIPAKERKNRLNRSASFVKWTFRLENSLIKGEKLCFKPQKILLGMYRPFTKKWLYYNNDVIERTRLYYTKWGKNNKVIFTSGRGANGQFSVLASNVIPNMDTLEKTQGYMRYDNEPAGNQISWTPDCHDNMNQVFADKLGLSFDDTFAYVYGVLNLPEYQTKYENDLRKDLARIPILKNKEKYVEIGNKLINLHINYENVPVYSGVKIVKHGKLDYRVTKMRFAKKRQESGKLKDDRTAIVYNNTLAITNIPERAYQYVVNGRSAIEWIMDQYQITTDRASGITDDPNEYSQDPKYIFNLLLRIINVSLQTLDLIDQLPSMELAEN